jgi:polysaccharide deacetylase 2 family uncharacterized protein YibQ
MASKKPARKKSPRPARHRKKSGRKAGLLVLLILAVVISAYVFRLRAMRYLHENFGWDEMTSIFHPGPPTDVPKPRPKPKPASRRNFPEVSVSEKGVSLLLKTKSGLEKNAKLFDSRLVFSDCSATEHLNCLEVRFASDSDFIIAEKYVSSLWDEQGFDAEHDPRNDTQTTETLIAVKDKKRLAAIELVLALPGSQQLNLIAKPGGTSSQTPVAIVIDDLGNNLDDARALVEVPQPVTFSILPFQAFSSQVLALAKSKGKPVMLHMPMEPEDFPKTDPGAGALLCTMTPEEIKTGLDKALDSLPGVTGVNNHMGSSFTSRDGLMRPALSEIEKRGLFFLDSRTTKFDVGFQLGQEMGMRTCTRELFLDNLKDQDAIWNKMIELCLAAKNGGSGIAIGHPYPETIEVLRTRLPELDQLGCRVAPIEELCP